MKKTLRKRTEPKPADADEILPEYDFSRAAPNMYAPRYAAGAATVIKPDVAPTATSRNNEPGPASGKPKPN